MRTSTPIHALCRWPAPFLFSLVLLGSHETDCSRADSAHPSANLTGVFDMDGRQIIQDEGHLGIINGKLTTGINYRDVAGVSGLWAPPYVSSNFMLDGRVSGEKVPTTKWTWRPFQVERQGSRGSVTVSSTTTLVYGHRAAVASFTFKNSGRAVVPLDSLLSAGWTRFKIGGSLGRAAAPRRLLRAEGRQLTLRQGQMAVVLAIDSAAWQWEMSGNLGHALASLPARQTRSVNVVIAIGRSEEATASVAQILADPAGSLAAARREYARQVEEIFEKLPSLESDNAQLGAVGTIVPWSTCS